MHNYAEILEFPIQYRVYKSYTLQNFKSIPQIKRLSEEQIFEMEVVGSVFPFKANNYVVDELINWNNVPNDPIFVLTFPQKGMLIPEHFDMMASVLKNGGSKKEIQEVANKIRLELNPHPAGQKEFNVPVLKGEKLEGMQHKYKETVLFFPSQGQTCHAYCTFCFRWPQFVGLDNMKFAMRETRQLIQYLNLHPEVTDVLFTGGDPMVMRTKILSSYFEPLLMQGNTNVQRIRIGTKSLGYWPYRFLTDKDSGDLLELFRKVTNSGKHLSIMAHFSHPEELKTDAVKEAIARIRETGAEIRTQSPLLAHINDSSEVWEQMWTEQVNLGCIPYYMFIVRNTGAQHYFGVSLRRSWDIFRKAYKKTSGLSRTVRGPSMSTTPGKIQILGVSDVHGEKVFALQFIQGRNPNWVLRPFFAKYDENALWLNDLKPAFGESQFFFEKNHENTDLI